jgi:hypothetical protein
MPKTIWVKPLAWRRNHPVFLVYFDMPQAKPIHVTEELRAEFWKYVDQCGPDECWDWPKLLCYGKDGYGNLKGFPAHRVSFALHYWEPPVDLEVCHTCDRPPCCNPAHLFLGTHKENHRDSALKGRRRPLSRTGAIPFDEQLRIAERMKGGATDSDLAKETGRTLQAMQGLRQNYRQYLGIPLSATVARKHRIYSRR